MGDRPRVPRLIARAAAHGRGVALIDEGGSHTYGELLDLSERWARRLLAGRPDLQQGRVALLAPPGLKHVAAQWGIWRAGGVVVPLAVSHPAPELARLLVDADPEVVLVDTNLRALAAEAAGSVPLVDADALPLADGRPPLPTLSTGRRAMMVYTSGTTGRPKAAVSTHAALEAQITALVSAWEWTPEDRILHVLPLHHVHGIVNALTCALWAGASCEFHQPGDLAGVWDRLASGEVSVFMAVPTLYHRLVEAWAAAGASKKRRWSEGASGLRLMVSGSAALPVATLERWQEITGHRLLERYGMTEIGMALGNPLHGDRRAGTVGQPFAGVQARIVDDLGNEAERGRQGEIQVRGPQVFLEYWRRPEETQSAFTADGWFRTGDEGVIEDGYWRILGRRNTDIIKTGGYKVSALEIEEVLRQRSEVADAAVVGMVDPRWGERVCAAVVASDATLDAEELRSWCKGCLAPYKVPKQLLLVHSLPRNALGKVVKAEVRRLFVDAAPAAAEPSIADL